MAVKESIIQEDELDIKKMMKTIKSLQKELKELKSTKEDKVVEKVVLEEEIESEPIDIPMSKAIKVISLYNGGLTLFTQARGQGKPYRFNNFGVIRSIIYSDLLDCIAHQSRYFIEGFCMILDKDVNKNQGLDVYVKNFLTKSQIENILSFDAEKITYLLTHTTKTMLSTIVENVTFALVENKSLDMNKVKIISDIYGRDINEIVTILKESR
jgi:hypothetical protein